MHTLRDNVLLAGRYRIGPLLGRGGMAEVYEGFDERLHRDVAVKVLQPAMAADPDIRRRFEDEARSAARLNHPNVVAVFDTGEDGDVPFLVMERLPGETLGDRLRAGGVDPDWLLRVAGDVLPALGAAHAAGIVHRDVKPGNILLAADGCAKVADFGIAKGLDVDGVDPTHTTQLLGTPAYLAPERLAGAPATPQSDLYALGVVLSEGLAGMDVPAHVTAALDRAMARDPQARFASAAEMAAALDVAPPVGGDDPTIVAAAVAPDPNPTTVLEIEPEPEPQSPAVLERVEEVMADPRRARTVAITLAAIATVVVLVLGLAFVASAGDDGDGDDSPGNEAALADGLRGIAAGFTAAKDGPAAPAAAGDLRELADLVEDGKGAAEANALLTRLASWRNEGGLNASAADRAAAVVAGVPGVNPAAYTPPTTTPPPPAPEAKDEGEGDGEKRGKGKKDDD